MDDAFAAVRRDRSRGARSLSLQALTVVDGLLERWRGLSDRWLRSRFRLVAANLTRAQPAMGPFRRWASGWRRMARGSRTGGRLARARAWVRRERERLEEELIGIGRTSRVRFPRAPYVVTLSRSESVLTALRAARGSRRPRRISVLESRPGGEGKAFAADLRRAGLPARTIPDRRGAEAVARADLLLIGADAVFSDGSVAHKVGTKELARTASRCGVPVVVVSGVSKFVGGPPPQRGLPPLFDRTPARYIHEYWTDRGVERVGRTHRHPFRERFP